MQNLSPCVHSFILLSIPIEKNFEAFQGLVLSQIKSRMKAFFKEYRQPDK